ncbi:MAG TPA: hypothetical protein VMM58_10175 [Bacteroidota bacterium]|nr:hypothetical protein [Bacteroidota bacterium]
MPAKLLVTIIGFNSLAVIFLAAIIIIYLRPGQFGIMASVFLGWLTGFINLGSTEAQFPVLLLLAFGFFIGFITQKKVWKYAFILGAFVPLSEIVSIAVLHPDASWFADGAGSLIAFVPAFMGVYLGKFIAPSQHSSNDTVKTEARGMS